MSLGSIDVIAQNFVIWYSCIIKLNKNIETLND